MIINTTLQNIILSGWARIEDTWAYASASTITVPSDATTKYQIGQKIRLKQGAGYKYYYIIGVASTTLTVTGGTDFTVANAGITDIYVSSAESPFLFPDFFDINNVVIVGFSADPTYIARFKINNRWVIYRFITTAFGTSNATNLTISLPVTAKTLASATWTGFGNSADSGTLAGCRYVVASAGTVATIYKDFVSTGFTASGNKAFTGTIYYEI